MPAVLGDGSLSWAMPSVPYAGNGVGFFMIPPIAANVWVEFEGGDIDHPIWSGCFWETGEVPASPAVPQMKMIKMDNITLTLSELPGVGGVTLEVSSPAVALPLKMTFDMNGIKLDAGPLGTLELTPSGVKINSGALEVTLMPGLSASPGRDGHVQPCRPGHADRTQSTVMVSSQPIVTQTTTYTVAGCPFTTPAGAPLPCVTAQWVMGAMRVKAGGMPVLLQDSQAITVPNGVPLTVSVTQVHVKGM